MAKKIVKGVLVDVTRNVVEVKEITYDDVKSGYLDVYYKMLNCDTIDIVERRFKSDYLDIYIDDNGALYDFKIPSIITKDNGKIVEVIYGNAFICGHDGEGGTISLTNEQIKTVLSRVGYFGYFGQKVLIVSL